VRAVNKANIEVGNDQNVGMAAVKNYDGLVNIPVEKRRLQYAFDKLIMSPELREIGAGDVKDDRLARAIGMVVTGYELPRAPAPAEVFNRSFLPARGEREMTYRMT
jgi:NitT/TauT family transport system substrate-binding protein